MSVTAAGDAPHERRERPGGEPPWQPLATAASARFRHVLDLAAAEARLATMSGLSMVLLVLFAGASLVIAWALVVASAIYLLAQSGLSWPSAALGFAVAHAGLAYLYWQLTVRLSRNLTLPETRRAIAPEGEARQPSQHDGRD